MKTIPIGLLMIMSFACSIDAIGQIPSAEWQIKTAVLAAPEEFREEATVMGYTENGDLTVIRKGTNAMICLADDPNKEGFSAAAYHHDLEPFMARGRALKAEGIGFKEIFEIREKEAKSGKLPMPERATLYVFSGDLNTETNEIENQYVRYVFYVPFATAESTGLPTKPIGPTHPWIMDAGTHRAHIMITPKKN